MLMHTRMRIMMVRLMQRMSLVITTKMMVITVIDNDYVSVMIITI